MPTQNYTIEPDEVFALATLLCIGLLVLSWRFLLLQRREVTRRIAAEQHARELAMQDALTGLPNRRQFGRELRAAIGAPPRSRGAHAVLMLDLNKLQARQRRVRPWYWRDLASAQEVLGALRNAGVHIALDDFGTGYSSLYYLRNFKIDKIKIDRSFIDNMEREPDALILVRALPGFGHGLGLTVTAEGVEQPAQATTLLEQGCQQAQGYLYDGHAMPAAEALDFIAAHQPAVAASRANVA